HCRCEGREEDPRDQQRSRGTDLRERRLRRDRRPARDRAGDQRGAAQGALIGAVVLALLLFIVGSSTYHRARFLTAQVGNARPNDRPPDGARRVENEVEIVLGQRKLLKRLVPGLMHAFIFWGFIVLFPTIVMAMIAAVDKDAELPWLGSQTWFGWMVD